ncbi:uncharacterized protein PV09_01859 [Verruconis gallopava]|uniref:Rhodopsin domain-containing protein n=1 Tax=Verruconis gallopava TaxID=253628 RepID=A0A0D2AMK6_9PEZI|nr:uncharacterized protein PV09_01859 [Verruconis gallopava]KIW07958.1 hypothetical protein PV09_01859 [Verruconis gallopava]
MGDRSLELLGTGIAFVTLTLLTFGLRVYVRAILLRKWRIDDWLMTCSVTFFAIYIACQTGGIVYGTGKHLEDLQPERAQTALVFWWLCELFYIPAAVFLKLSVGVFLHDIAINRYHVWIVRFMMVCSGLFGSAYFLLALFQCKPISAWWIRKHSPYTRNYGWCFNNTTVVAMTFASSGLNSIADWTFGIIPIFMVKDLQMPTKQKRLVAGILGFANIACIATIVRMPFIMSLYKDSDFLYETIDIALWSNVEPGVGIAAACIATLRPLLQQIVGQRSSAWFSYQRGGAKEFGSGGKNASSSGQSYALRNSLPNLRPDRVGNYTEITAGTGRRPSNRDPLITGREMKALFESQDLKEDDAELELHLRTVAEEPARTPGVPGLGLSLCDTPRLERKGTLEIQKSVEVIFTEEIEAGYERTGSPAPANWPLNTQPTARAESRPMSWEDELPPLDTTILTSLGNGSRSTSRQSLRKEGAPGAVGDPFGAWR